MGWRAAGNCNCAGEEEAEGFTHRILILTKEMFLGYTSMCLFLRGREGTTSPRRVLVEWGCLASPRQPPAPLLLPGPEAIRRLQGLGLATNMSVRLCLSISLLPSGSRKQRCISFLRTNQLSWSDRVNPIQLKQPEPVKSSRPRLFQSRRSTVEPLKTTYFKSFLRAEIQNLSMCYFPQFTRSKKNKVQTPF